jgi:DtxR family Mn-dependent transcriptional regulator
VNLKNNSEILISLIKYLDLSKNNFVHLTITEENYLKAIYKNNGNTTYITTNTLAMEIAIKPSSVTDMLKKLKQKKLILYKPYAGCRLSGTGEQVALGILRKHRLWETFLCNTLGFAWDEVHGFAEELEHVGNTELINRLDSFLGHPQTDPHGDAIPDKNGKIKERLVEKLSNKKEGTIYTVSAVQSHEKGILEMLNHYKIKLGSPLEIISRFDYDESIEVRVNHKNNFVLPRAITNNILVME